MASTFESRTITVRIERSQPEVYDFAAVAETFRRDTEWVERDLRTLKALLDRQG